MFTTFPNLLKKTEMNKIALVFPLLFLWLGVQAQEEYLHCGKAAAQARALSRGELNSFEDPSFDLKYYRFEWYVDPAVNAIAGTVTPWFTAVNDGIQSLEFNLYTQFTIDAIQYHGSDLSYVQNGDYGLTVFLPAPIAAGTLDSLSITYHGTPHPAALARLSVPITTEHL